MKFIPNQSDLFWNLYPSQSKFIRVNPKKVFNFVSCKSVENLCDLIWVNPNQCLSPNESKIRIIRIENSVYIWIESDWILVWIKSLGLTRTETNWFLIDLHQTRLNLSCGLTQMGLNWLGIDFGMNQNKSDWLAMNFNPKLLTGQV